MKVTTIDNLTTEKQSAKPYERLACAILLAAIKDLHKKRNLALNLDAALWLATDAPLWLDAIGLEVDPLAFLAKGDKLKGVKMEPRRS